MADWTSLTNGWKWQEFKFFLREKVFTFHEAEQKLIIKYYSNQLVITSDWIDCLVAASFRFAFQEAGIGQTNLHGGTSKRALKIAI